MILNETFFQDPFLSGLIRKYIISELTGKKKLKKGDDIPLLEYFKCDIFSSNIEDFEMFYNGYTFYCVGNIQQVRNQIESYKAYIREKNIKDLMD
jgi:hypothetical protein